MRFGRLDVSQPPKKKKKKEFYFLKKKKQKKKKKEEKKKKKRKKKKKKKKKNSPSRIERFALFQNPKHSTTVTIAATTIGLGVRRPRPSTGPRQ